MKIAILNGNPSAVKFEFDNYITDLTHQLEQSGHEVTALILRKMDIRDCIGCYNCWLKTPGICIFKDDMASLMKTYLAADVVVMASPLLVGYVSALLKRAQERMRPLVHPYLHIDGDRMSHLPRYTRYPAKALLLDKLSDAKPGTLEILEKVNASGGKHEFLFTLTTEQSVEEAVHAFNSL